jgi:putative ABC transport system permease protein
MFRNYLKIAYRNLLKNKTFSLINILGLTVAMTAGLLILQYVRFELSYDTFQDQYETLYRVQTDSYQQGELQIQNAFTVPALAPTLAAEIPEVQNYFRLTSWADNYTILLNSETPTQRSFKEESAIFADPSFVSLFSFDLFTASADSLLQQPNRLIISESTAQRYFGETWQSANPVGQTVVVYTSNRDQATSFMIEGVFRDMPKNSHLSYDIVFSHASLPNFLPQEIPEEQRLSMFENSWGPTAWYTYLQLNETAQPENVSRKITELIAERNPQQSSSEVFILQPIQDIHLYSQLANEPLANGNATWVFILLGVAGLILVVAWVNYLNFTAAHTLNRLKEISVRKIIGARPKELLYQFMCEGALTNLLALALAITFTQLITPYIQQIAGISFVTDWGWGELAILSAVFLVVLLISYNLISSTAGYQLNLGNTTYGKGGKKLTFNRYLVVFQFAVSLFLASATLIIFQQVRYMQQQDLGIDTQQVVVIERPNVIDQEVDFLQTVASLRNALESQVSVEAVSAASLVPGSPQSLTRDMHRVGQSEEVPVTLKEVLVGQQYLTMMDIDLIAGSDFSKTAESNRNKVIINVAALEGLGFSDAESALGSQLGMYTFSGLTEYEIIGVTENFHQQSLQHAYQPLGFFYEMYSGDYLVKINRSQDVSQTLAQIQTEWAELFPGNPFQYYFLDQQFAQQYQADHQFRQLLTWFSVIALIIASLGLFGLSLYHALLRTREVGIRKVLGASVGQVVVLLSKDFIKLVVIGSVVALPLVYWAMQQWLQQYAFRIDLSWWLWALPFLLIIVLSVVVVGAQTVRTALTNPVDSLRNE